MSDKFTLPEIADLSENNRQEIISLISYINDNILIRINKLSEQLNRIEFKNLKSIDLSIENSDTEEEN